MIKLFSFLFLLIADLLLFALLEMRRRPDFFGDVETVADKLKDDLLTPSELHETKQETRHPARVSS